MIKLIIFDLDGVLVEAKNIHYDSLNKALGDYAISWNEHLSTYDGLKTSQKLNMLTKAKGLPVEQHQRIWEDKAIFYSYKCLKELKPNKTSN
jgi:beta-phosphoglucomutase